MRAQVTWADQIANVSTTYMNATVSILDPSLVTSTFDVATNEYTSTGSAVVASGISARVQPVRLSVDTRGGGNPSGEVRIRVQIPRDSYSGRIKRGWLISVTAAERNPELLGYLFAVDSEVNSSWRATTTIEATVNVENVV
jgi:hypothetical protein